MKRLLLIEVEAGEKECEGCPHGMYSVCDLFLTSRERTWDKIAHRCPACLAAEKLATDLIEAAEDVVLYANLGDTDRKLDAIHLLNAALSAIRGSK